MERCGKKQQLTARPTDGAGRLLFLCVAALSLLHFRSERRSGNVLLAPLDDQNVVTALPNVVVDLVLIPSHMLDLDLLARTLRTVHTNVEDVVACFCVYFVCVCCAMAESRM